MLRLIIILFFSFFMCFSCKEPNHNANKLCDCYRNLHIAKTDDDVNFWGDSCIKLYLSILQDSLLTRDELKEFEADYRKCQ